jgi:predicted ABC-type transport system involved in lysophospholipase L1 biosynthesis ATPase subunit
MTSTQVTPAADPSFTPAEGFVRTGALDTATGEQIGEQLELNRSGQPLVGVIHNPGLAAQYASRTIQVADGPIASGVDAGAQR